MSWQRLLAQWKKSENHDPIIALTDVAQMKFVIWAFAHVEVEWRPPPEDVPDVDDIRIWREAWKYVDYDIYEVSVVANVPLRTVEGLMQRAIAVRLVYPDGTLNKYAAQYMRRYIAKHVKEVLQ